MKISKIASAHNWNIIPENFVRLTEEVAGQSVRQLKIFISRLGMWTVLQSWIIRLDKGIDYYTRGYVFNGHEKIA